MNQTNEQSNQRVIWMAVGGIAAVSLCLCMGLAGFALGWTTAAPETIVETVTETETVTEIVEVTREVPIIVEAEAPENPTPVPTAVPIDDENEDEEGIPSAQTEMDFAVFDEAWDVIEQIYDGDMPDEEDLLYSAIEGSVEVLGDDFTRFVRPEIAARLREDMGGAVSGIGAFVRENEEGFFEIVTPIEGQPADLVGLLPGDIVSEVDGESVIGLSFDEIIMMVRGPSDTTVVLTIARAGEAEPLEFSIVRATYEVPVVEFEMLPDNIAYIRLHEFNRNAEIRMLEALDELMPQQPRGLILDLRRNPGGFLDQSVAVADIFLPESVVLYRRNRSGLDDAFRADDGDIAERIPLVVLVNESSASASEIVAGAIQDNERGALIGTVTFGKGSVQNLVTLSDGSELRITTARWYTPDNNAIDGEGITPDIEVESPQEIGGEEDDQLQRAVEYILTGQ
ncbi:MAG: S41 family peptidase [Chloroflexi bacterium]|nr:S41 family peptidase [Chloroflexota bacterium]